MSGIAAAGLALPELVNPLAAASALPRQKYPNQVLWSLPKQNQSQIAWTVDDGFGLQALTNYIEFAENTDTRLTFFITSNYQAWRKLRKRIIPLAQSGQIQLANHTKSHASLTKISNARIRYELTECDKFIRGEYGVKPAPIFRPPFGFYDARVIREANAVGFTTPVMWYGSLGDGGGVTNRTRLKLADKWMTKGRIVIAHANSITPPADLLKIRRLIDSRNLTTVTLDDVWRR